MCRMRAGPGIWRSHSPAAHGCRTRAARVSTTSVRTALSGSASGAGAGISAATASTISESTSSLLATWLYSDITSYPSSPASLRIDSASVPRSSAMAIARATIASRSRGPRSFAAALTLDNVHCTDYNVQCTLPRSET